MVSSIKLLDIGSVFESNFDFKIEVNFLDFLKSDVLKNLFIDQGCKKKEIKNVISLNFPNTTKNELFIIVDFSNDLFISIKNENNKFILNTENLNLKFSDLCFIGFVIEALRLYLLNRKVV